MLYGREAERSAIDQLIEGARAGVGGALVVRGVPGIGKSALLETVRAERGLRVLTARGIEGEADLPLAGLHQLLRPVWAEVDDLLGEHARTIKEAFGTELSTTRERFLIYSDCLNLLSELASRTPIACLVDDAHWLDSSSSEALLFCARRLEREPIAMLFGVRDGEGHGFGDDLPSLKLDPLSAEQAAALLRRSTDIADAVADRILTHARGNPLAVIELPRALDEAQLSGIEPLPDQLPLTAQLESSYTTRIRRLSTATQSVLLVAATDDSEDVRVIARAAQTLDLDPLRLDDAERAGLIRVQGSQLEFAHPLIRSALLGSAASGDRRAAHRALAVALEGDVDQADRRAWHLATAAVEPDESIVLALEEAAARAQRRGGHVAAARALERAASLSTDPEARSRRLVRAAHNLSTTGRDEWAMRVAGGVDDRSIAPVDRTTLAFVRASAAIRWRGRPTDAIPNLIETARDLAADEPRLAVRLLPVATFAAWQGWDHASQLEIAEVAAGIDVERLGDTERHLAKSIAGFAAMLTGDRMTGRGELADTIAWGHASESAQEVIWAAWAALWVGDDDTFGVLLRRSIELSRRDGEIGALAEALGMQSVQLALLAQRYDESAVASAEAVRMAIELGAESLTLLPRSASALIAAVTGDDETALATGEAVVRLHRQRGHPFRASPALYAMALVDMVNGRWTEALDTLAQISDPNDPALAIAAPEIVEAAVRSERADQAMHAFDLYEQRVADAAGRASQSRLEACRGLLATSAAADAHFERALASIAAARPFDRPRVQLLYGEHLRRTGRRLEARQHLRDAVAGFETIGARPWAERARRELQATGETSRRRTPDALTQLTPQELQIARLVADGLTNKEIAAQLYLSPRTIDAHLRGVFAKLGITSRRELRSFDLLSPSRFGRLTNQPCPRER